MCFAREAVAKKAKLDCVQEIIQTAEVDAQFVIIASYLPFNSCRSAFANLVEGADCLEERDALNFFS